MLQDFPSFVMLAARENLNGSEEVAASVEHEARRGPVVRAVGDEKEYDLKNRIFICYILCTSILCAVPLVPYLVSKELYKRGRRTGAAISMEVFMLSHCMLTFSLVFIKVLHFLNKTYGNFLSGFFITNRDLAILALGVMCAFPVLCFVLAIRYSIVYDMVKTRNYSVVEALLSRSYLSDVSRGIPALVCYTGRSGPLLIRENGRKRKRYGADIFFDVYIYSTSYLLVLPSCLALLCDFFQRKKKRTAMAVTRVLAVSAHMLLTNVLVVSAVTYVLEKFYKHIVFVKLHADSASIALLNGIIVSSLILAVAVVYCYWEIGAKEYGHPEEISDDVARSVLKFGILTVCVNCVCSLFRDRAELSGRGFKYGKKRFVHELVRRITDALFIVPALFWQLSNVFRNSNRKMLAAVANRACLYTEIFLGNLLIFSLGLYAVAQIPAMSILLPLTAFQTCIFLGSIITSVVVFGAIARDLYGVRTAMSKDERWEDVVWLNEQLSNTVSNFGVLNLIAAGLLSIRANRRRAPDYVQDEEVSPVINEMEQPARVVVRENEVDSYSTGEEVWDRDDDKAPLIC